MTTSTYLKLGYYNNLLVLGYVFIQYISGNDISQDSFTDSVGWRLIALSLWSAIFIGSILGISSPSKWANLLLIQIIYKVIWLSTYVIPLAWDGRWDLIPPGITISFTYISLWYPYLLLKSGVKLI